MGYFTADNTEGFAAAEIQMMNDVAEKIICENDGIESYSVTDAINNAYARDVTATALDAGARKLLGLK